MGELEERLGKFGFFPLPPLLYCQYAKGQGTGQMDEKFLFSEADRLSEDRYSAEQGKNLGAEKHVRILDEGRGR